jgi:hypothetical protein
MTRLLASEELEVLLQEEVASEEESPFEEVLTLEEVLLLRRRFPWRRLLRRMGPRRIPPDATALPPRPSPRPFRRSPPPYRPDQNGIRHPLLLQGGKNGGKILCREVLRLHERKQQVILSVAERVDQRACGCGKSAGRV